MQSRLSPHAILELKQRYPELPEDYFQYLANVGWGQTTSGRMIYEGPVHAPEIYGQRDKLVGILLLGDDFQGYCLGYHLGLRRYGEVASNGTWEQWPESDGFETYLADPSGDAT